MLRKKKPPKDTLEEEIEQNLTLFSLRWGRVVVYLVLLVVLMALVWTPEWLQ